MSTAHRAKKQDALIEELRWGSFGQDSREGFSEGVTFKLKEVMDEKSARSKDKRERLFEETWLLS